MTSQVKFYNQTQSKQYVHPKHLNGQKALYCAFCYHLSHCDKDQHSNGILYHDQNSMEMNWFCSAYCKNAHCHENGIFTYDGLSKHIHKNHPIQQRMRRARTHGINI
jgi:hypothetical protein